MPRAATTRSANVPNKKQQPRAPTYIGELDTTPTRHEKNLSSSNERETSSNQAATQYIGDAIVADDFEDDFEDIDLVQLAETQPLPAISAPRTFSWSEAGSGTRRSSSPSIQSQTKDVFDYIGIESDLSSPTSRDGALPDTLPLQKELGEQSVPASQGKPSLQVDFSETATTVFRSSPSARSRVSKRSGLLTSGSSDKACADVENTDSRDPASTSANDVASSKTSGLDASLLCVPIPNKAVDAVRNEAEDVRRSLLTCTNVTHTYNTRSIRKPSPIYVSMDGAADRAENSRQPRNELNTLASNGSKSRRKRKQRPKTPLQFHEETQKVLAAGSNLIRKKQRQEQENQRNLSPSASPHYAETADMPSVLEVPGCINNSRAKKTSAVQNCDAMREKQIASIIPPPSRPALEALECNGDEQDSNMEMRDLLGPGLGRPIVAPMLAGLSDQNYRAQSSPQELPEQTVSIGSKAAGVAKPVFVEATRAPPKADEGFRRNSVQETVVLDKTDENGGNSHDEAEMAEDRDLLRASPIMDSQSDEQGDRPQTSMELSQQYKASGDFLFTPSRSTATPCRGANKKSQSACPMPQHAAVAALKQSCDSSATSSKTAATDSLRFNHSSSQTDVSTHQAAETSGRQQDDRPPRGASTLPRDSIVMSKAAQVHDGDRDRSLFTELKREQAQRRAVKRHDKVEETNPSDVVKHQVHEILNAAMKHLDSKTACVANITQNYMKTGNYCVEKIQRRFVKERRAVVETAKSHAREFQSHVSESTRFVHVNGQKRRQSVKQLTEAVMRRDDLYLEALACIKSTKAGLLPSFPPHESANKASGN
ncbi:hypothetical protein AAL_07167 [Moelleriella libera RCEF 2490]|uniref:Uncharacterized protein n=1 Tax=Moelleriella libera RCEF 2490 TaxID=1081109 RepID=A0A167XUF1_9HYPO|nr:hypothetical protein AAL_07167 [Moelleriella libera RCEF 2490]